MSFLFTSIRVYQSRNVNRLPSISKVIHDTLAFPDTPLKKVNFVLRSYVVVSSQFIADHAHFLGSNAFFFFGFSILRNEYFKVSFKVVVSIAY